MHIEFVVTKRCCVYRPPVLKRKMYNLERMYKEAKYVGGAKRVALSKISGLAEWFGRQILQSKCNAR